MKAPKFLSESLCNLLQLFGHQQVALMKALQRKIGKSGGVSVSTDLRSNAIKIQSLWVRGPGPAHGYTVSIVPILNDAESLVSHWISLWLKPKGVIWAGLFNFLKCPGRYQHGPECPWINKCWQAYFTRSCEVPQSSPAVVDGFNLKKIINL